MLGHISKKYESGDLGVHTVSSGINDPGGVSYGAFQLSSKTGTMKKFLLSPEGSPYMSPFIGTIPGSKSFNEVYRKIAKKSPNEFHAAQHTFIRKTHYEPVAKLARSLGYNLDSTAVQEVIWSMSVQHSFKGNRILLQAAKHTAHNVVESLRELYSQRTAYVAHLKVAESLRNRYESDLEDVLALI